MVLFRSTSIGFARGGDGIKAGSSRPTGRGVVGPSMDLSVMGDGGEEDRP